MTAKKRNYWHCVGLASLSGRLLPRPDAILVAAAPFYTFADVPKGIDLCPSLVKADCGSAMTLPVARKSVDFFLAAALKVGGTDNGSPGLRPHYGEYY